jgi:hypothetical protein
MLIRKVVGWLTNFGGDLNLMYVLLVSQQLHIPSSEAGPSPRLISMPEMPPSQLGAKRASEPLPFKTSGPNTEFSLDNTSCSLKSVFGWACF